jgi:hypothetical protein
MAQPVKLSDSLVLDARLVGEAEERSIAGQIEYWARLGRAADLTLQAEQVLRLKRIGDARPLSECLESVGTKAGRDRLGAYLQTRPYPRYEPAPGRRGLLIRVHEDGKRELGKFVKRKFKLVGRR